MKCTGCGCINVHEALYCEKCGRALEDWNPQSLLRKRTLTQIGPSAGTVAAVNARSSAEPKAAPTTAPSLNRNLAAPPSTASVATRRATTAPTSAPAPRALTPTPPPPAPRGLTPTPSPQAPPSERSFTLPETPADLRRSVDSNSTAATDIDPAAARLNYYVAASYRGLLRTYAFCAVMFLIVTQSPHSTAGGFATLILFFSIWPLCFHAIRIMMSTGVGQLSLFAIIGLLIPYLNFIVVLMLALGANAWLNSRGIQVSVLGPDDRQLRILRKLVG